MTNSWYSFSVTDVGVKRTVNQDSIYADDQQKIWVVADGMGGHRDGDKASQAIVKFFQNTEFSHIMSERIIQIEKNIRALNTELQNYSTDQLNGQLIGSTIITFTVCQGLCATVWAGDSRCYKVNDSKISQVSWDHSYIDELVRSGHMVEEEAATSKLSNVITRAVGAHAELYFDHVISSYSNDDTFLLCSDGLTNELSDKAINSFISQQGCSQQTIDNLLTKTLEHGARDNVSIILISCKQRKPYNPQESKLIKSFSNKLNTLAGSLFNKEIELDSYYLKTSSIIDQAISSHHHFTGQETQELPATKAINENPTAEFPKVSQPETFEAHPKVNYILLLSVITILLIFLLYLLLIQ